MRWLLKSLMLGSLFAALSGCKSVRGIGQDVQKAGEKIEDAAKKK